MKARVTLTETGAFMVEVQCRFLFLTWWTPYKVNDHLGDEICQTSGLMKNACFREKEKAVDLCDQLNATGTVIHN